MQSAVNQVQKTITDRGIYVTLIRVRLTSIRVVADRFGGENLIKSMARAGSLLGVNIVYERGLLHDSRRYHASLEGSTE